MEPVEETSGYRPVSRLAVAAAVAGALGSLALTTPVLWIVPLAGVALAVAALADVARPGAEKAGRAAALVGLALSVGFGAQAVASAVVSRWIAESRVEAIAAAWLDAIRDGRLAEAQGMMAPSLLPHAESRDQGPGEPEHRGQGTEPPVSIGSLPEVAAILDCGPDAAREVRCLGRDEETGQRWRARVRLGPCLGREPVELRLELAATVGREGRRQVERWTILRIDEGS